MMVMMMMPILTSRFTSHKCVIYFLSSADTNITSKTRYIVTIQHKSNSRTIYTDIKIYIVTAIGLSPGDSSTARIYTQTVHRK